MNLPMSLTPMKVMMVMIKFIKRKCGSLRTNVRSIPLPQYMQSMLDLVLACVFPYVACFLCRLCIMFWRVTLLNWILIFSMVIVMVTVGFIYRPPIPREIFNSWMMRFVHLGAQIGNKPMPCLNLNWIQTSHWRHIRIRCFSIWDGNHRFLTWRNYIDRVYTKDFERRVFVDSIILAPSLTTFQVCWLLCMTSTSNVLTYYFFHSYFFLFFFQIISSWI